MNIIAQKAQAKLRQLESRRNKGDIELKREQRFSEIESGDIIPKMISWLETSAKTERGIKVKCSQAFIDHMSVFGDLRINYVPVSGSAQVYKSLSAYLTTYFYTEIGLLSVLFTMAKASIRNKLVASTVKPLFKHNDEMRDDAEEPLVDNTNQRRTSGYTLYTSFTNNPSTSEAVEVPIELASITVDFILVDEFGQSDPGIVAVLPNRMNASQLEFRPVRVMSTPGKLSQTIDLEIEKCEEVYEPMVVCPHCEEIASLTAVKALLKPVTVINNDGEIVEKFYDESFIIQDWNYTDTEDKAGSAYIACEHCNGVIDNDTLLSARLYERTSHKTVDQLKKEIDADPYKSRSVGLIVSPLLKIGKRDLAPLLIKEGLNSSNPKDFLQQRLGIATQSDNDSISIPTLRACLNAPRKPTDLHLYDHMVLAGIDQARGAHYSCIADCYVPRDGDKNSRYRNTIRSIRSYEKVSSDAIPQWIRKHGIEFTAIDLAPDFSLAIELQREHDMIVCLQKKSKEPMSENNETEAGGIAVVSHDLDNQYFLNTVVKSFTRVTEAGHTVRLPPSLKNDLLDPPKTSAIYHIIKLHYDVEKQMWLKCPNKSTRNDYIYAQLFLEAALYYKVFNAASTGWLEFFS